MNDSEFDLWVREREVFYRVLREYARRNEAEWTHFMSRGRD